MDGAPVAPPMVSSNSSPVIGSFPPHNSLPKSPAEAASITPSSIPASIPTTTAFPSSPSQYPTNPTPSSMTESSVGSATPSHLGSAASPLRNGSSPLPANTTMIDAEGNSVEVCPQCQKTFKRKVYLQRHMEREHWSTAKVFKCQDCNYETKHQSNLSVHRRTHTGEWKTRHSKQTFRHSKQTFIHSFTHLFTLFIHIHSFTHSYTLFTHSSTHYYIL